jgi:hypothetical protein
MRGNTRVKAIQLNVYVSSLGVPHLPHTRPPPDSVDNAAGWAGTARRMRRNLDTVLTERRTALFENQKLAAC